MSHWKMDRSELGPVKIETAEEWAQRVKEEVLPPMIEAPQAEEPSRTWTSDEREAISWAIRPYLKPDIDWPCELEELIREMEKVCDHTQVLCTGASERDRAAKVKLLEAFRKHFQRSPTPLQWHYNRQLLDDGYPSFPQTLDAMLAALRRARNRFDAPYAFDQSLGPRKESSNAPCGTRLPSSGSCTARWRNWNGFSGTGGETRCHPRSTSR